VSEAAARKRLPFFLPLAALVPENRAKMGSRPWGGICLLAKGESQAAVGSFLASASAV